MPRLPTLRGRPAALAAALVLSGGSVAALLCLDAPASAQGVADGDGAVPTPLLTFGVVVGAEFESNPELLPDGDPRYDAVLGLRASYVDATPTQELGFAFGADLRAGAGGPPEEDSVELVSPDVSLSYRRRSRDALFTADARASRAEVSGPSALELILRGGLEDLDPVDLAILLGEDGAGPEAEVLRYSAAVALETGIDEPLGITYGLELDGTRTDGTPGLEDASRVRAGIGLRADLTPVLIARADLAVDLFDRDRKVIELGLARAFRRGGLGLGVTRTEVEGSARTTVFANGSLSWPLSEVAGSIGATKLPSGETTVNGSVGVTRALPRGEVSATLSQGVRELEDVGLQNVSGLRTVTILSADWNQQLTRAWRFGLNLDYTRIAETDGTGSGVESFGRGRARLSRPLTRDWRLSLGAGYDLQRDSGGEDVGGASVSLSLSRDFRIAF